QIAVPRCDRRAAGLAHSGENYSPPDHVYEAVLDFADMRGAVCKAGKFGLLAIGLTMDCSGNLESFVVFCQDFSWNLNDLKKSGRGLRAEVNGNGADTGRNALGRFTPGHKGTGGRKLGSRNKLSESFLADLHAEWKRSGKKVLQAVAEKHPETFLRC